VFEDCSSLVPISIYAIRDLAFVFHAVTLEKKLVNCAGMTRVFFTRYRLLGNRRVEAVDCQVHSPFSSTYVESYPSRMWYFLLEVKHVVEKMLNDPKQYQLCRKMSIVKCSYECWQYFRHCMMNSNAIFINFRRKQTDKLFHCDLSLSSVSSRKELELIRIENVESILCARNVFGTTFGIGIRNRAPKKGENPVTMHFGDVVNLVDVRGVDDVADINHVDEFVYSPGVDFIYDCSSRSLKIRVRYSRFLAQNNTVLATLQVQNEQLPIRLQQNDWDLNCVTPGTLFIRNGIVVEVVRVNQDNVVIREETSQNEVTISHNEAANLIDDYLA
jgi:hypothetical protein